MHLYSVAQASDLLRATQHRFEMAVGEALEHYKMLCCGRVESAFVESVALACSDIRDSPGMWKWVNTLNRLRGMGAGGAFVPNSSVVGHFHIDSSDPYRLLELLGWQAIGASWWSGRRASFELSCAPPKLLAIGSAGVFQCDEQWPTKEDWTLEFVDDDISLQRDDASTRGVSDKPIWSPHLVVRGEFSGVTVPIDDQALTNREFQDSPIIRSRGYICEWLPALAEAATIIRMYSDHAISHVRAYTRCVAPLMCDENAIGSGSPEEILGLLFLPATFAPDQLAECLLHESMHQYLFRLEACGDLFLADTPGGAKFYSPWRTDQRPLRMVLHGAFVFSAVADFYSSEITADALGYKNDEGQRHAYFRAKQAEIAFSVVEKNAKLTRFGQVIFQAIKLDLEAILSRVQISPVEMMSIDGVLATHRVNYAG